jgi:hypothetical protein
MMTMQTIDQTRRRSNCKRRPAGGAATGSMESALDTGVVKFDITVSISSGLVDVASCDGVSRLRGQRPD